MSDGSFFVVPARTAPAQCRSCHTTIYWVKLPSGKAMPVDCGAEHGGIHPSGHLTPAHEGKGVSHFATCPNAAQHRKARR